MVSAAFKYITNPAATFFAFPSVFILLLRGEAALPPYRSRRVGQAEQLSCRVGNSLIRFRSELLIFCKKWANNVWMSDLQKKNKRFAHSLIYGERPEPKRSFLVSDLSDSLTFAHLSWATWGNCSRLLFWHEQPVQFATQSLILFFLLFLYLQPIKA